MSAPVSRSQYIVKAPRPHDSSYLRFFRNALATFHAHLPGFDEMRFQTTTWATDLSHHLLRNRALPSRQSQIAAADLASSPARSGIKVRIQETVDQKKSELKTGEDRKQSEDFNRSTEGRDGSLDQDDLDGNSPSLARAGSWIWSDDDEEEELEREVAAEEAADAARKKEVRRANAKMDEIEGLFRPTLGGGFAVADEEPLLMRRMKGEGDDGWWSGL